MPSRTESDSFILNNNQNSKTMEEQLIIHGISRPAYCEAIGLSKCFEAYAKTVGVDDIESVGFNANSGWVYIALECGVSIGSLLGRQVEFIAYDAGTGEEYFYDTYEEALDYQHKQWAS
jgi:hypothetical protein